ncbi:MAG: 5'-3' exonuclease H3TH domain-containing protein, partial [Patescibacteria group bacterium]
MKQKDPERIVLLDSNAIVHRAFHALPPLTSPTGEPTNAVYGFVSILLKIIAELKPTHMLAAFDLAAPTFRHKAFAGYKATRGKAPDELYLQFPPIKKILGMLSVPIYEKEGYEADDIIGTAVKFFEKKHPHAEILIVTGDLDTLQLISPNTKVYTMRKGLSDTIIYDEGAFRARFGFPPEHMIDYKGLRGDPSDNIPGIRGIGEKTAMTLVQQFGTIEDIYKNISKVKPDGVRKKLEESKEEALFSKELSTINTSSPVSIDLESALWRNDIKENKDLRDLFQLLGFFSLLKRLDMASGGERKEAEKKISSASKEKSWKEASKDTIQELVGEIRKDNECAAGM